MHFFLLSISKKSKPFRNIDSKVFLWQKEEAVFFNKLNNEDVKLVIIKKLVRHKSIYEIRLDGGSIYPRILFTLYRNYSVMTFGVTKHPETKGQDGITKVIDDLAFESELIISAIYYSSKTQKEYLGRGDDIIEIQF